MQRTLTCNAHSAATTAYDMIIVGGGIGGTCLALEAVRHGLRPIVVEKRDFGWATSSNTLRVLHGGLRYLQTLDLGRFKASVAERNWFLRNFPELTELLPCLLPLYGCRWERPRIMQAVLRVNNFLSRNLNASLPAALHIPPSGILSAGETKSVFPRVEPTGLLGSARWYDAVMARPARLIWELIHWAVAYGADFVNYMEVVRILRSGRRVVGIECRDGVDGATIQYQAPVVVNCAGPWSALLTAEEPSRSRVTLHPTLAFNVLLDQPSLSSHALAVSPPGVRRKFFLLPVQGRILAGTQHLGGGAGVAGHPSSDEVEKLVSGINQAIPGFQLGESDVLHVYAGNLPAESPGSDRATKRPIVLDHGKAGGTAGLITALTEKYTTARRLAGPVLRIVEKYASSRLRVREIPRPTNENRPAILADPANCTDASWSVLREQIVRIVKEESVVHFEDLVARRLDDAWRWQHLQKLLEWSADALQWNTVRQSSEMLSVMSQFDRLVKAAAQK